MIKELNITSTSDIKALCLSGCLPFELAWRVNRVGQSTKDAIRAARAVRIAEIDKLQAEVNELDKRFDQIEDAEMASGN